MTLEPTTLERGALDEVERRLTAEGYTVIREPRADQLPAFVSRFVPDAIATGKAPNLLIEVLSRRRSAKLDAVKIEQLRKLVEGNDAWKLEVVYTGSSIPDPTISGPTAIRHRFEEVRSLAPIDNRATLMMAWSILEATARALVPDRAERPLTPASIVELIASLGFIDGVQAETLRNAGRTRNLIAHGDLTEDVSSDLLRRVLDIVDYLIAVLERAPM
jgi:hypothetical protein